MYICICNNITETKVKETIQKQNITKLSDLVKVLDLGSGCGQCLEIAKIMLLDNETDK